MRRPELRTVVRAKLGRVVTPPDHTATKINSAAEMIERNAINRLWLTLGGPVTDRDGLPRTKRALSAACQVRRTF
jgi:hypothetical protein